MDRGMSMSEQVLNGLKNITKYTQASLEEFMKETAALNDRQKVYIYR